MFVVVCFKQKTEYEVRISDWSSDVCSSDLSSFPHKLCLSSPNVRYPEMYINWPSLIFFDSKSDKACDTLYSLYSGLTTPDPLVVTQAVQKKENMTTKNLMGVDQSD